MRERGEGEGRREGEIRRERREGERKKDMVNWKNRERGG